MKGVRRRRHHQRSRNGCAACKQHHIRCDERKPYCWNCLRNGRSCGYSGADALTLNSPSVELTEEQIQLWTPSSLDTTLSKVRCGPFELHGVNMCQESKMLFDHYNNYRILTRTPIRKKDPGGESFKFATSDTVLMHTAVILAANHWIRLGGNPNTVTPALYHHKVEAIRIINERLGDPAKATLDGTVGAIAAMTLAEITCGSPEIATHHLNGLEYLMELRGDLHSEKIGGLLQRMILLADTLTSSETSCNPRFLGNILGSGSSRRSSIANSTSSLNLAYASPSGSELFSFSTETINCVDWETTKMFKDLQYLSAKIADSDSGILMIDGSELADTICSAEKYIDSLIHERIERVDTNEHNPEFASLVLEHGNTIPVISCALSGSIYVYLFIRRIPLQSSIFDWMIDLFQQDFERTEAAIRMLYSPEQLWWMLFVVGTASLGWRRERSWILRKLNLCRDILRLNGWREAKEILEKVAWVESAGELYGKALWEELDDIIKRGQQ